MPAATMPANEFRRLGDILGIFESDGLVARRWCPGDWR
jgi:hypothetical protein